MFLENCRSRRIHSAPVLWLQMYWTLRQSALICCCILKVRLRAFPRTEQITRECADGMTRVPYDPLFGARGTQTHMLCSYAHMYLAGTLGAHGSCCMRVFQTEVLQRRKPRGTLRLLSAHCYRDGVVSPLQVTIDPPHALRQIRTGPWSRSECIRFRPTPARSTSLTACDILDSESEQVSGSRPCGPTCQKLTAVSRCSPQPGWIRDSLVTSG